MLLYRCFYFISICGLVEFIDFMVLIGMSFIEFYDELFLNIKYCVEYNFFEVS